MKQLHRKQIYPLRIDCRSATACNYRHQTWLCIICTIFRSAFYYQLTTALWPNGQGIWLRIRGLQVWVLPGSYIFFLILKIPDAVEADRVVCVQALLAGFWDKVWGNESVRKLLTEPETWMSLARSEPVAGTFFSWMRLIFINISLRDQDWNLCAPNRTDYRDENRSLIEIGIYNLRYYFSITLKLK